MTREYFNHLKEKIEKGEELTNEEMMTAHLTEKEAVTLAVLSSSRMVKKMANFLGELDKKLEEKE